MSPALPRPVEERYHQIDSIKEIPESAALVSGNYTFLSACHSLPDKGVRLQRSPSTLFKEPDLARDSIIQLKIQQALFQGPALACVDQLKRQQRLLPTA
jgi:hypothetical protein